MARSILALALALAPVAATDCAHSGALGFHVCCTQETVQKIYEAPLAECDAPGDQATKAACAKVAKVICQDDSTQCQEWADQFGFGCSNAAEVEEFAGGTVVFLLLMCCCVFGVLKGCKRDSHARTNFVLRNPLVETQPPQIILGEQGPIAVQPGPQLVHQTQPLPAQQLGLQPATCAPQPIAYAQPGPLVMAQPSMQPGIVQPGMVQPGVVHPGMVQPGMVPVGQPPIPPQVMQVVHAQAI